jgi:hypothetical protein
VEGERSRASKAREPPVALDAGTDWTIFWDRIANELSRRGYGSSTRTLYRSVLRNFYRYARCSPDRVDAPLVQDYFEQLAETRCSWREFGVSPNISSI